MADFNGFFWKGDPKSYYLGHQFSEIFKSEIYKGYINEGDTVLDLGANIGIFSLYAQPIAKIVYAFEPTPDHFECLEKLIEYNEFKNIVPIRKAIANKNGKQDFFFSNNQTMNSLKEAVGDTGRKIAVDTVTLDTFFDEFDIDRVNFMKLDIEGSEGEILQGAGFRKVNPKVDSFVFEYHTWSGMNINQIINTVRDYGYEVTQIPEDATLYYCRRTQ